MVALVVEPRVSVAGVLRGDILMCRSSDSNLRLICLSYGVTGPRRMCGARVFTFVFFFVFPILFSLLVRRVIWPLIVRAGSMININILPFKREVRSGYR